MTTILDVSDLEGSTFELVSILEVFQQVDTILAGSSSAFTINIAGDSGTAQPVGSGETISFVGGNGIATQIEGTNAARFVVDISPVSGNIITFDTDGKLYATAPTEGGGGGGVSYEPKYLIADLAHGLGSAGQIKLIQGDFTLAQANSLNTTADYAILIVNADSYYLLGAGFHSLPGHGLTQGVWYALSDTTAGGYEISYLMTPEENRQNCFIPVDSNTIYVNLQETDPGRVVPPASKITQSSHGFSAGSIVSRVGASYVVGVAGEFCHFVKEVVDVNNFILSRTYSDNRTCVAGKVYAVNPAVDGAIVALDSLDSSIDPITIVGFASATNLFLGFCESPQICCGDTDGVVDDGEFFDGSETLVFAESWEGGAHEHTYTDGFGFASSDLDYVSDAAGATDGSYYLTYTTASANTDFLTYYSETTISPITKFRYQIDFAYVGVLTINCNPVVRLMEAVAASQDGFKVNLTTTNGNGGFWLNYGNNKVGELVGDSSDIPASQSASINTWYRLHVSGNLSTAQDVSDGEIVWKVETLQGSVSGGSDGTVVGTLIPERTISGIKTHDTTAPSGLNFVRVAGGYISRVGSAPGVDWGAAYDNFELYEVA